MKLQLLEPPAESSFPVVASQSKTEGAFVLAATRFPCGEKATDQTGWAGLIVWPLENGLVMTRGRSGTFEAT
jgi:hypothetical protein